MDLEAENKALKERVQKLEEHLQAVIERTERYLQCQDELDELRALERDGYETLQHIYQKEELFLSIRDDLEAALRLAK